MRGGSWTYMPRMAGASAGTVARGARGIRLAHMPDPLVRREGNLRLVSVNSPGYPLDPPALGARVQAFLDGQEAEANGPLVLLFALAPGDDGPATWECQTGYAVTGMAMGADGVVVEDYRQLTALHAPHLGPIRDLPETWRRLDAHARAMGWRPRPYWRLALRDRRLADGNLLPEAEVSVFVDR